MKLLIISHTPHYKDPQGGLLGWGPTVLENTYISNLFDESRVIGTLHSVLPSQAMRKIDTDRIRFIPVSPSGGTTLLAKFQLLGALWSYFTTIKREINKLEPSDWIYVRCPCNIGLIALFYLSFRKRPKRWIKYAGNWSPPGKDALSYKIQRWILKKNLCRCAVTINGEWPGQPAHIHSFLNPSFKAEEISSAMAPDTDCNMSACKLLFVGRIESEKGLTFLLALAKRLIHCGFKFHLDIIGSGKDDELYRGRVVRTELDNYVTFHGEKSREALKEYYQKSRLLIFPSHASEGWPKVLSEAMAFGCVPIASDISSIPQVLNRFKAGISLPLSDIEAWVKTIQRLMINRIEYNNLKKAGMQTRHLFTYEDMVLHLKDKIVFEKTAA